MALLSRRALGRLQRVNRRAMDCTATIKRPPETPTKTAGGGTTSTPATVASNVPCRLRPARQGEEVVIGGFLTLRNAWVLEFEAGADVTARDQYEVSGMTRGVAWLRYFEAVDPRGPMSYEVHRAVLVKTLGTPG